MKKTISLMLSIIMIMSTFLSVPILTEAAGDVSINFDNLTEFKDNVDYLRGGAYSGEVTVTTEQDHTSGKGKSLKIDGRTAYSHRVKFINAVTSDMVGKKVSASAWVLIPKDAKILIGAYSTVNTTYAINAYAYKEYDVKANTWTLLSLEFENKDSLVTQIGIAQSDKAGDNVAQLIYVDDLFVTANGSSAPATTGSTASNKIDTTTPATETKPETSDAEVNIAGAKYENVITFDNLNDISEAKVEGGGGAGSTNFALSSDTFYASSGEGKSLVFTGRSHTYSRVKFMSAFDGLPQKKGVKYNISMMVKISDTSRAEAGQVTMGIVTFLGQVGNGKEYYYNKNYRYTVKKNEWTKVEMPYESTGQEVFGVTLDQVQIGGNISHSEYVISEMFIDNVIVKVSDEEVPPQPVLSDSELRSLSNLGIDVYINNKRLSFMNDTKPTIVNNRTLVPMRKIFEAFGASVMWDDPTQTVTAHRGNSKIKLTIGKSTAYVNGEAKELDVPAQLLNNRTLVPVRFIAESLGCEVNWDEENQKVLIKNDKTENEINLYKDDLRQEIYGFGAAANHNAYYLMNSSEEMQQKTLKALYDPTEGIGLNIVRLEVNPYTPKDKSNFALEFQYTISPEKDVWDMDADVHQIWYMKEALKINPSLSSIGVPWSPPAWMKENKSVVGKTEAPNILAKENYDYFAEYLARWVKHYNDDLGFNVKWLSIQNEPGVNAAYAGCQYTSNTLFEVTKLVTKKFKEEGIKTLVGGPESSNVDESNAFMSRWYELDPEFVENELGCIVTHSYGYTDVTLGGTNLERFNKPLLQTEKCTSVAEKREFSNTTLMKYANEIADHLNHNYNAWCYWYGIRRTDNLGTQNGESLIDFSDTTKEISCAREYYALGQFSKFIRPGYVRIGAYSLNPDVAVTSAVNPETGKLVTVVINNSESDTAMNITGLTSQSASVYRSGEGEDIAKLDDIAISNGIANVTFKAQTITTIVEQ